MKTHTHEERPLEGSNDCGITHTAPISPAAIKVKFSSSDVFLNVLRQRVDDYFASTGRRQRDCFPMYVKSAAIFTGFIASYVLLVFWATTWWQAWPLAILLGTAIACIGFNIQHDGAHGSYSKRKWINSLMAMSLDLIGGSSYAWKKTHNQVHHTFTNITGHDGDIDLGFLGRLSPHQRWLRFHRLQHVYIWFLYGLVSIKWILYDDIVNIFGGKVGTYQIVRPKGWHLMVFVSGKLLYFSLAFLIPMMLHPWYMALLFYFVVSFVQGLLLSVVFQMAHCVEEADFPMPQQDTGAMENAWAVHQVETTVNFARRNRVITWLTGGLNHQIEHHLFPRICHVNYPAIAKVVEETCRDFGVNYSAHDSSLASLRSHYRWLRQMGRQPENAAKQAG